MLKFAPKTYYYGEFGCLNYCILGHLERLCPTCEIATQPDYLKLMQMVTQGVTSTEIQTNLYRADCKGAGFGFSIEHEHLNQLHRLGFVSLKDFLHLGGRMCIEHMLPISKPLTHDMGLNGKYVSVSFRNRQHEAERNLSADEWVDILEYVRSLGDYQIIAHGMNIDTLPSDRFEARKAETIEESIAFLNKSSLFIGSMSGTAQFASNCACPILQVGDITRHFHYDPFNKGCEAVEYTDHKSAISNFLK